MAGSSGIPSGTAPEVEGALESTASAPGPVCGPLWCRGCSDFPPGNTSHRWAVGPSSSELKSTFCGSQVCPWGPRAWLAAPSTRRQGPGARLPSSLTNLVLRPCSGSASHLLTDRPLLSPLGAPSPHASPRPSVNTAQSQARFRVLAGSVLGWGWGAQDGDLGPEARWPGSAFPQLWASGAVPPSEPVSLSGNGCISLFRLPEQSTADWGASTADIYCLAVLSAGR